MEAFRIERDAVLATGPDAATYLQGQLSQDLRSLAVGESVRALLLEPTGKTVAWLRVTRLAGADVPCGETADTEPAGTELRGEAYLLDTDAGIGPAMRRPSASPMDACASARKASTSARPSASARSRTWCA